MDGGGVGEVMRKGGKRRVGGAGSAIEPGAMDSPYCWTLDHATALLQSRLLLKAEIHLLRLEGKAVKAAEGLLVGVAAGTGVSGAVAALADAGAKAASSTAAACPVAAVVAPSQHSPLLSNRPPEQKQNNHGQTGLLTPSSRCGTRPQSFSCFCPPFRKFLASICHSLGFAGKPAFYRPVYLLGLREGLCSKLEYSL